MPVNVVERGIDGDRRFECHDAFPLLLFKNASGSSMTSWCRFFACISIPASDWFKPSIDAFMQVCKSPRFSVDPGYARNSVACPVPPRCS